MNSPFLPPDPDNQDRQPFQTEVREPTSQGPATGNLPSREAPALRPELAPTPTFVVWDEDPWAVRNILRFIGEKVTDGPKSTPVRLLLPAFNLAHDARAEREAFAQEIIQPPNGRSNDARLAFLNFKNREEIPGISDLEATLLDQLAISREQWGTPVAISYLPVDIPRELTAAESCTRAFFERLRTPTSGGAGSSPDDIRRELLDAAGTEIGLAIEGNRALTTLLKEGAQEAISYYSARGERVFVLMPRLAAEAVEALQRTEREVVVMHDSGAVKEVGNRPATTSPFADPVRDGLLGRAVTEEDAERRLLICGARWAIQRTLPPAMTARASFRDLADDRLQTDILTCAKHVVAQLSGEVVRRLLDAVWKQLSTRRGNVSVASVLADTLSIHVAQASGTVSTSPAQQRANLAKLHDRATEWLSR